jgi:23S rRNA (adenine2030-N6)-methyltransferase
MLSYRHAFHAGNHADILKHITLTLILEHLKEKPSPVTVYDTHAGAGRYALDDERLLKTGEAETGIKHFLHTYRHVPDIPAPLALYLDISRTYAASGFYPGSPEISRCLLRPGDRLVLSELHNTEIDVLRGNMEQPPLYHTEYPVKPQIHHRNGYEMLRALTPPETKRGIALIDPSYEDSSDYTDTADTVIFVHKKWASGILALWYPLLAHRKKEISDMKRNIKTSVQSAGFHSNVLDVQLLINTENSHPETKPGQISESSSPRLYGSGLLIINAPWKLDSDLSTILPELAAVLGSKGSWNITA